jgi:hypothetical protein
VAFVGISLSIPVAISAIATFLFVVFTVGVALMLSWSLQVSAFCGVLVVGLTLANPTVLNGDTHEDIDFGSAKSTFGSLS